MDARAAAERIVACTAYAVLALLGPVTFGGCGAAPRKEQPLPPSQCGAGGMGGGGAGIGGTGAGGANASVNAGTAGVGGALPAAAFPSQTCRDTARDLVAMMTLDEKLAQTMMIDREQITPAQLTALGIGAVYSQGGSAPATNSPAGWADMIDAFQQGARASRLGIPVIYGIDSVHGLGPVRGATVFPHNIGLGATRNPVLVEEIARLTTAESKGCGHNLPFSPVLAVALDERWGRTYEAFGETTELASSLGVAMVKGLQFAPDGTPTGVMGNAKHYVGDGGTALGVTGADTAGDEATLRAIHLEPFRAAIAARVGSVMASYSSWQGTKMHLHKAMLTDVLKGELGFGGFVLSDYNACYQVGLSNRDGLGACMNAGVDMFMLFAFGGAGPTILNDTLGNLRALVQACIVPESRVDDAVRRILAVKCEMGLLAGAGAPGDATPIDRALTAEVGSPAHRTVARQAVRESVVVLKNEGNVLPLAKTVAGIALGGNSADNTGNQCGGWTITWQGMTGNVVPGATSVRAALAAVVGADKVAYSLDGSNRTGATVGLVVVGELPYSEGRGDLTDLTIPPAQVAVARAMKQAGLPTVVVLIAGRPMILDPILPFADAVVMAWLPGSEGAGITDILFGDAQPTGKLPHSWPRSMAQIPLNQGDATYDPLFPYGFGLTY